ncbi:MAG: peptidylprolyl isomerase [Candidatus Binatia bacterium]|nr:peptidylprolyl isomerase [Candidatus Binatia bacterium]
MKAWLSWPPLHFVVGGVGLIALRWALGETPGERPAVPVRAPIVISVEHLERLGDRFERRWGAPPRPEQLRALVAEEVQEEILYREAKRLALDYQDGSVRLRLVQKMRAVSERPGRSEGELAREAVALGFDDDVVIRRLLAEEMRLVLRQPSGHSELSDEKLREVLETHRDEFLQPERVTFSHVFLSADVRGDSVADDAAAALALLQSDPIDEDRRAQLSDAFPLGLDFRSVPRLSVQGRLGKPFSDEVFRLEPGTWSGPVESPYGLHLVRVEEILAAELPPVAEVRPRVLRMAADELGRDRLATGLVRLRRLYDVRIADSPES